MTTLIDRSVSTLPPPRGPLSQAVVEALRTTPGGTALIGPSVTGVDPFGDDLTLALHTCYELHYRGFTGVDSRWEWDPELLRLRAALEDVFMTGLRAAVPGGLDLTEQLDELLVEVVPGDGVSHFLRDEGQWWHLREYLVVRSIYHLKEADPHAWVIPRLRGHAKAALVAVEFDEFGGGRGDRMHQVLYADLLRAAGLSDAYLHYLPTVPAEAMATVNLMSMLGLHRAHRGGLVGHFAAAEISTPPSARRITQTLQRLGATERSTLFFTEHVEADAVHEQIMRQDVVGNVVAGEPDLVPDVVFGIQATELLERRLADRMLTAWRSGRSVLRDPLPAHPGPA